MQKQQELYANLDQLFHDRDPWEKTTKYQQTSEENILSLVQKIPHASILEVGCADGKLTKKLTKIADRVVGIDVSKTAIAKAVKNVPEASFAVTSLEDFRATEKFDVIICSEILYYVLDTKKALSQLERLGKYLITSHFITCFPEFCLGSIKYEFLLRRYKVLKTVREVDLKLGLLVIKRLRKLP